MACWLCLEARFNAKVLKERIDISEAMRSDDCSGCQKNSWSHTTNDTWRDRVQKFIQSYFHSCYLCTSFQFHMANLCQLSSHRLYPNQVKLKLSAEQLPRRKYWRVIYFKIICLTLLSGYTFIFYFKILLDSFY